jgi:hypothetical protein
MASSERSSTWIRNPLTVIGVFAGVSEVSGTVVLPRLAEGAQATFIWFVMGFPCLLVILFFVTLNFNPKCLYAPSDYRDEGMFSQMMSGLSRNTARESLPSTQTAREANPSGPASSAAPNEGGPENG